MATHNIYLNSSVEKIFEDFFKDSKRFSNWIAEKLIELENSNLDIFNCEQKLKQEEQILFKTQKNINDLKENIKSLQQKEKILSAKENEFFQETILVLTKKPEAFMPRFTSYKEKFNKPLLSLKNFERLINHFKEKNYPSPPTPHPNEKSTKL